MRAVHLLAALLATLPLVHAGETRTLTSKDGRSIEAEIVSYKGDTLRMRRADTKREFTLPLSSLSEDDQTSLRAFFHEHPELRETALASDLRVEFTRVKFDRSVTSDTNWRDETVENWGYTFQVTNRTSQPLEGLRIEYIIFARRDPDNYSQTAKANASAPLQRTPGKLALGPIGPGGRGEARTSAVAITRVSYEDDVYTVSNNGRRLTNWRDREIHGLWFRLYDGDKLIQEGGVPEALRKTEKWDAPAP